MPQLIFYCLKVSIHAPNEGSDPYSNNARFERVVSIHAPNEGSDIGSYAESTAKPSFNPRSQ